jgi:hypothetical protein
LAELQKRREDTLYGRARKQMVDREINGQQDDGEKGDEERKFAHWFPE